jgi:hypothetical protein
MDQNKRQQDMDRISKYFPEGEAYVTNAARNLGRLRGMTAGEIESRLVALEDEVVRHLQVSQAVIATDNP